MSKTFIDPTTVQTELESMKWISYGPDIPIIRRFWMETFGARSTINPTYVVPDLRVVKTMVIQGLGISVLPDYLIHDELLAGTLKVLFTPPKPVVNDLWVVHRSSDSNDSAFIEFLDLLTI